MSTDSKPEPEFSELTLKVREYAKKHGISNAAAAHRMRKEAIAPIWAREREEAAKAAGGKQGHDSKAVDKRGA